MKNNLKVLSLVFLFISFFFVTGFVNVSGEPQKVYRVYLKGESLELKKKKTSFENYIDTKQQEIKRKYKVNKVYVPTDLDIVKEITFEKDLKSNA